jgi:hypothetical protein
MSTHDVRIEVDFPKSSVGHDRVCSSALMLLVVPNKMFDSSCDTFRLEPLYICRSQSTFSVSLNLADTMTTIMTHQKGVGLLRKTQKRVRLREIVGCCTSVQVGLPTTSLWLLLPESFRHPE